MPLMMTGALPPLSPEQDFVIPGGEACAFFVAQGQLLVVTDFGGGQPAALYGVSAADPEHLLSPHHTRIFSNSFVLEIGMRLITNRRRPAMVLGVSPAHLAHDLMMPMTNASKGGSFGGADRVRSMVEAAFHRTGATPAKIADPINLFLNVAVGLDGSLTPAGASSRAGDTVVFRSVLDMTVAVAAPLADERLWSRAGPGPIGIQVRNEVASIRGWIKGDRDES